jgi:hypothetical protein
MSRNLMAVTAFAALVAGGSIASADLSRNVISAFRGQLVVSAGDLPEGKNDADTIKKIKAAQVKEISGTAQEDNTVWHFHYTAFLSKTGATKLKLEFMSGNKLSADQQLDSVDPKSAVLSGDITIDENEGLAKGKTYTVNVLSGSTVVAKTSLTMK